MKIKELIEKGIEELNKNNIEDATLKVRLTLANLLDVYKEYLMMHDDVEVAPLICDTYFLCVDELAKGKPVQYIIKKQEFYGYDFYINENVLIPQPDTELLVEETLSLIKKEIEEREKNEEITLLDLCTGSGIIGESICKKMNEEGKNIIVSLSDISRDALDVAEINSKRLEINVNIIESDLFENINSKYDVIVSNPPYIKTDVIGTLSKEVQNEPLIALDGGKDGLFFYRRIISKSKNFLNDNGLLLLEIGYDQKDEVMKIFKEEGFENIYSKKDYSGNDRIVVARKGA